MRKSPSTSRMTPSVEAFPTRRTIVFGSKPSWLMSLVALSTPKLTSKLVLAMFVRQTF